MTQKKRDRCLQEVTLLAQLSHPYIIQMLDAFIDENMLIIVFEWAPAGASVCGARVQQLASAPRPVPKATALPQRPTGDLKRLIKKTAEAGKTLDETAIWGFFSQVRVRPPQGVRLLGGGPCLTFGLPAGRPCARACADRGRPPLHALAPHHAPRHQGAAATPRPLCRPGLLP